MKTIEHSPTYFPIIVQMKDFCYNYYDGMVYPTSSQQCRALLAATMVRICEYFNNNVDRSCSISYRW